MCSCCSDLLYSFFTPTVSQAYYSPNPLTLDNTLALKDSAKVQHVLQKLAQHQHSSLSWSLWMISRQQLSYAALLLCIKIAADLSFPLFLRFQLDGMENDVEDGYIWALASVVSTTMGVLANQKHIDIAFREGIKLKAVCSALVFDTALYRTSAELDNRGDTTGMILNLVSSDSAKLQELAPLVNLLWAAPVQILIATILITHLIGLSGFIGVVFLGIGMPLLNYCMIARIATYRRQKMTISDERVKLSSEMLAGIRVVKFLSWEAQFVERILDVRLEEMKWVTAELHLFATYICILISFPMLSLMVCFGSYVLLNPEIPLTAGNAFAALALFNVLRFPLMQMGTVLSAAAQARVAVQRIETFLNGSEYCNLQTIPSPMFSKPTAATLAEEQGKKRAVAHLVNSVFVWSQQTAGETQPQEIDTSTRLQGKPVKANVHKSNIETVEIEVSDTDDDEEVNVVRRFALGPINATILEGNLVAIVGAVGAGKSMFVSSLLGETHLCQGDATVTPALSYVPQAAWIINASVRENIVNFVYEPDKKEATQVASPQLPLDKKLYTSVLKACALDRDIKEMPDNDQQIIGERGVTLSGGQKQRIALARASYSILMSKKMGFSVRPPLLLLDDPLSALDAHTSRFIFDALLGANGLLKNVARVLVTHAVQFLSQCHRVFLIHKASLVDLGPFDRINDTLEDIEDQEIKEAVRNLSKTSQEAGTKSNDSSNNREGKTNDIEERDRVRSLSTSSNTVVSDAKSGKALMTTEQLSKGSVGLEVVVYMASTFGTLCTFFLPLFAIFVLERCTYVGTDWWLAIWTGASNSTPTNAFNINFPAAPHPEGQRWYASFYAVFVVTAAIFVVCRLHFFARGFVRTARIMFRRLLQSTVRAPMLFFETTPLGRITNRFSFDTEVIDAQLFQRVNGVVASTSWILGGIGVMIGTLPWMTAILIPVMVVYFILYRFYRKACVEIQRLSAVTRSPIHSTFQEALIGASSIRAFNVQRRYVEKNRALVDDHSRAMVSMEIAGRWLSCRLELLGVVVIAGACMLAFFLRAFITAGMAGLVIMWSAQFSMSLNFNTINLTEAESLMTSVERVMEYIIGIEKEADSLTLEKFKPNLDWPQNGGIIFDNAVMSYRDDLPPALCGLTVEIKGGMRVGIVGRTGAGKSSIATALFRLRDLTSGMISVDGVDLSTLGLSDVRGRSMAIITQDPLVFSGPIRMTLDPFNNHTDKEIWTALAAVQMSEPVKKLWANHYQNVNAAENMLTLPIAEAGRNLSVGERQLLCFARALLLRPKILVLDEATASVDYETDRLIQVTLRDMFPGTTLLVVAHRLQTIIDLDSVLVMEEGKCVEFNDAATLLDDPESFFSGLCDATGPATNLFLREQAEKARKKRSF